MALAVRRGELKRSDVYKEVLDIVDSDMTDKQIEDFAKERTSNKEHNVSEGQNMFQKNSSDMVKNHVKNTSVRNIGTDLTQSPLERYLKSLQYAGRMTPMITVKPDIKYVFIVVKPGFTKLCETVINRFEDEGFHLYKTHSKCLSLDEAKELYKVHKDEDFYDALCEYMTSDISTGILMTFKGDVEKAFDKTSKLKDELRKQYGESDMRNLMHSSDDVAVMRREASMYFNELI